MNINSPYHLSSQDEEKLQKSGFYEIFAQIKDYLSKKLDEKYGPITRYDVQIWAMAIMNEAIEMPEFTPFKSYLYEKGETWEEYMLLFSIALKDYYLSIHPEIKA